MTDLIADLKKRMDGAISSLNHEFAGLRTGRASASMVDNIHVEAYGSFMPMNQVASVNVPEPRLITLQVWDKGMIQAVEKAIINANIGLNPATDGQLIRLPVPSLTEERRKEMVKIAAKYAEQARVSIRNVRRDGMEDLKKAEKDGKISKDEHHAKSEQVQKLTDDYVAKVDETLKSKEKEITTI